MRAEPRTAVCYPLEAPPLEEQHPARDQRRGVSRAAQNRVPCAIPLLDPVVYAPAVPVAQGWLSFAVARCLLAAVAAAGGAFGCSLRRETRQQPQPLHAGPARTVRWPSSRPASPWASATVVAGAARQEAWPGRGKEGCPADKLQILTLWWVPLKWCCMRLPERIQEIQRCTQKATGAS